MTGELPRLRDERCSLTSSSQTHERLRLAAEVRRPLLTPKREIEALGGDAQRPLEVSEDVQQPAIGVQERGLLIARVERGAVLSRCRASCVRPSRTAIDARL